MLSTHIMQEVEAICDKVIIINQGIIVANDETKTYKKITLNKLLPLNLIKVFQYNYYKVFPISINQYICTIIPGN